MRRPLKSTSNRLLAVAIERLQMARRQAHPWVFAYARPQCSEQSPGLRRGRSHRNHPSRGPTRLPEDSPYTQPIQAQPLRRLKLQPKTSSWRTSLGRTHTAIVPQRRARNAPRPPAGTPLGPVSAAPGLTLERPLECPQIESTQQCPQFCSCDSPKRVTVVTPSPPIAV
jgi:hypothetical protein